MHHVDNKWRPKMKRLKQMCLALLALTVLGIASAGNALALPTILLLPENASSSILLTILSNKLVTALETELQGLKGEGVSGNIHFPNGNTTLGFTNLRFLNIADGTESCKTGSDAAGEVLVPQSQVHLVFDTLTPLGIAILVLVPEFELVCDLSKLKVTGDFLILIHNIDKELSSTEAFQLLTHCKSSGVPLETKWWNNAGAAQHAELSLRFGAGFESACLNIAGTLLATPNLMVGIMG
ncbi:MAG: hypothetical protein ACYDHN_12820 [Solirubrobacteraceae bacterium]